MVTKKQEREKTLSQTTFIYSKDLHQPTEYHATVR